jgi:hypothetical protein
MTLVVVVGVDGERAASLRAATVAVAAVTL